MKTRPYGSPAQAAEGGVQVQVVKPTRGGLEQTVRQPGSVHAFEWAALFAKVSGYLKTQRVDIGDSVKRGEVLAEIDAPELESEVQEAAAALAPGQVGSRANEGPHRDRGGEMAGLRRSRPHKPRPNWDGPPRNASFAKSSTSGSRSSST